MTRPTSTRSRNKKEETVTPDVATVDNTVEENSETPVSDPTTENTTPETEENSETEDAPRIPDVLAGNTIFNEFCGRYLAVFDEITQYNKEIAAEKDSEWTTTKVLSKARELGNNDDANKIDKDVQAALAEFDKAADVLAKMKRAVIETTAKKLGINLSSVAERDKSKEAPLKEKRSFGINIGTKMSEIAQMTNDKDASEAIQGFFKKFPMPAIGRDSARTFGEGGKATPKYRVLVSVKNSDGEVLMDEEKGFTKAAAKLQQPVFGYDKENRPKADKLREAWEKAGNSPEKTVTNPVVFEDNNLTFEIRKPE